MHAATTGRPRFNEARPITQDEVLVDYAYAELLEPGRWNPAAEQLAADMERIGGPANLTPDQRERFIEGIRVAREPMLGFLLKHPTTWFAGAFDVVALGALRLTSWYEQHERYAGARTIDELLESPGAVDYTKPGFRLDAMRGRPIMVASVLAGPYCLIEGGSRCCEIVRLARRGEMPGPTIPVILGVCENIQDYTSFRGGVPVGAKPWWVPVIEFLKGTLLRLAPGKTDDGQLVEAVGNAWRRILRFLAQYPDEVFRMTPREFEQFIAGCYDHDGYRVTLTPRSADLGRDVIAEKPGVGSIRVLDQVKQYRPGHVVTAEEVRAFLFVAQQDNASRCFITTTSDVAPRLMHDRLIAPHITNGFLEVRNRAKTIAWLRDLERNKP